MTVMDDLTEREHARRMQRRRNVRLLLLAAVIFLGYVAWALGPICSALLWESLPQPLRQSLIVGLLDGLLIAYAALLFVAVLGFLAAVVIVARCRGGLFRRPWLARLVVLDVSLLFCLVGLEIVSSVWMGWLHRSPTMTAAQPATADVSLGLRGTGQTAQATSAGGPLRILVVGESSARGEPYHPWLSVGQIVGWQLEIIFPGRSIQVDMQAEGGATLEETHQKLAKISYRPDALVLFSGHNEFQGRWAWSRNPPYYVDEKQAELSPVELVLCNSPVCRLIIETLEVQRASFIPSKTNRRDVVDHPTCTEEERGGLVRDFRRRLLAITSYCESSGIVPIFLVPGSNDGDYEPSRSALPASTGPEAREAFAREFTHIRELEQTEPGEAIAGYRRLLEQGPEFAETHYRLARLLEAAGQWDEARAHYVQARECDGMPMRCPEDFRQVYRDMAREHPSIVLVDSTDVLGPLSPHGIIDDHVYHDAQHPTFRGYLALAQAVLDQLHERQAFGWPASVAAPRIDPDDCARHFQLDKEKWITVCQRSAWFYGVTSSIRHDPTERRDHQNAYQDAALQIEQGTPAERVGIVGMGVHPAPAP